MHFYDYDKPLVYWRHLNQKSVEKNPTYTKTKGLKDERPMELRPQFLERYVKKVIDMNSKDLFDSKVQVVKRMLQLNVDNRTLNMMRETMNNNIEDENGMMKTSEFKKMIFTAYGQKNIENTEEVYSMLYPIIKAEEQDGESYVSIPKLGLFIDFFNFYPYNIGNIKQKNF